MIPKRKTEFHGPGYLVEATYWLDEDSDVLDGAWRKGKNDNPGPR